MVVGSELNGESAKKCFIITPMGKEGSDIRREMESVVDTSLRPALVSEGYEEENIMSPFSFAMVGNIDVQIIDSILESDLIIANLTGLNPNVMYELAISHFAGKPTILISRELDTVPFDIKSEYVIQYTNDIGGGSALQDKIGQVIKNISVNGVNSQNIIQQAIERQVAKGLLNLLSLSFGREQLQYKALRDEQMTMEIPYASNRPQSYIYEKIDPLFADKTMERKTTETDSGKIIIELKAYTKAQLKFLLEQVQAIFPDATTIE